MNKQILYCDKNEYPAFPSIVKLEKDKYLVSFRLAPKNKKNYSHLHSLSKAIVLTYYKNKIINTAEIAKEDDAAKQDVQLFRVDDKTIIAYYFRYTFHPQSEIDLLKENTFLEYNNTIALLSGIGYCISYDNGKTFSKANTIVLKNGMKNFAARGSMVKVNNEILMPIYAYKKYINKNNSKYQCYVIYTKDLINWDIKSFLCETEYRKIENKKSKVEYVEPSFIYHNNVLWAFIRTHVNDEYAFTSLSYSLDNGKSFTKPCFTNIKGYPLNPLKIDESRVLLSYGYRLKPYGVRAIILNDLNELKNFSDYDIQKREIIIEDKMKSSDCGYPWCDNDNNKIYCVYYGYDNKDKIRKIFLSVFTLD